MKKLFSLVLVMLFCLTATAYAEDAASLTGANAAVTVTAPADLEIYAGISSADDTTIMLIHDVMSGYSGRTVVQFYASAADAYLSGKADSWKSVHAAEENFINEVKTAEINGMQVSYIYAGYKTVNSMNREVVNGTIYAAVSTGDAECLAIEIDCTSQAKYGDSPVNEAFLEAFMGYIAIA